MTDSLVIGESIELIGSVASTNPACTGAVFLLQPGYDLGAPQPVTSIIGSMLLDGSRPFGYAAGNRTISLPIEIQAPDFPTLVGAREVLLREINQQTWSLRWTRDPGTGLTLPMLFDCFRAQATIVQWGNIDSLNRFPIGLLTLTFEAMPYGRTDVPVVVDFPSPLSGRTAPPAAINVDTFSSVSGTQWAASAQTPVPGGASAFWDPGIAPANSPQGTGQAAVYTKGSLALNLAAGWNATVTATGTTTTFVTATASAAAIDIGDQFQLWTSAPALIQTQIFTVTKISPPSGGNVTVTYSPASLAATVSTNHCIQTGPPNLPAVTFWAGFGSTLFYQNWARLGGRVTFAVTLTDTYSTVLGFSKTVKVTGSNASTAPRWNKIRIPVPYLPGFDYANVASYTVTVTNRGTSDLRYTQLYLSALMAVPPPVTTLSPQRGAVYELAGLAGSARAPVSLQFQQSGSHTYTQTFAIPGTYLWKAPPGVTSYAGFANGAGGDGAPFLATGGGGGSGGSSAVDAAVVVTAGNLYTIVVGARGATPTAGGLSSFSGDSVTRTAPGGLSATTITGAAAPAAGFGGFAGGAGGNGAAGSGGGGGGGGSAGSGSNGGTGAAGSGGTGGAGGTAGTGTNPGAVGGRGGTFNIGNGSAPTVGYGAGMGGSPPGFGRRDYGGFTDGVVKITYTTSIPLFQTLIAHRPPPTAPDSLVPFVSPAVDDVPNGTIQYPVTTLVPGVNARFGGTYTVVMAMWAWHAPTVSHTLTVTVTQWEQPNGASYSSSVSTSVVPNTLPAYSGNAGFGPLVAIGELTLPVQDMPQDNVNAFFTVSVTSSDTSDDVMDVLFLDTMGSTVLVQSPTAYANMFIDEPASDRDLGLIMGSLFDRTDAVSILDRATVAGGPMSVDPDGNPLLLAYCAEGAPNVGLTFHPRWWLDRQF